MQTYTIDDAQKKLNQLIQDALEGKRIAIHTADNQVVELVAAQPQKPKQARKAGSAAGLIHIADDFDAPLDDFNEY